MLPTDEYLLCITTPLSISAQSKNQCYVTRKWMMEWNDLIITRSILSRQVNIRCYRWNFNCRNKYFHKAICLFPSVVKSYQGHGFRLIMKLTHVSVSVRKWLTQANWWGYNFFDAHELLLNHLEESTQCFRDTANFWMNFSTVQNVIFPHFCDYAKRSYVRAE